MDFLMIPFFLIFFLAVGIILFGLIRGIGEWSKNNNSPRLTVAATVVPKRTSVSHHHHHAANGLSHATHSTSYYITFQVESGDRMELCVAPGDYGMIAEGDRGKLSFQGTRFLSFERIV